MDGDLGHSAWRWLFWIEGAATMGIAIAAAFILPDLPHNTRGFTKEELEVAQLRMTEDVGVADVDSEDLGTYGGLWMALKDVKVYVMMLVFAVYVVGLSFNAYFVSHTSNPLTFPKLTHIAADSHQNPRLRLRPHPPHERPTMGLLLHLLRLRSLQLRQIPRKSKRPSTRTTNKQAQDKSVD